MTGQSQLSLLFRKGVVFVIASSCFLALDYIYRFVHGSKHTCPLSKALVGVLGLHILMDGNLVCYCME